MGEEVAYETDHAIMGTARAAADGLAARAREWRALRQPLVGTAKELRENEKAEREARFQLANAALLWLWHEEQAL